MSNSLRLTAAGKSAAPAELAKRRPRSKLRIVGEQVGHGRKSSPQSITIDPEQNKGEKMRQAATQELYSYWNRLRGARLSPEREEIDPSAIRHILADTMILEVDDERQFPVRISGTRLNALFLDEQKGRSFVDLFAPGDRLAARDMISAVIDGVRPVVAGLAAEPDDARAIHLELLLLPLRHHGKTHARILGMLTPTALPTWFGLRRVNCLGLSAMRFVGEEEAVMPPMYSLREGGDELRPHDLARRPKARRHSFFLIPGGRED